MDSVIAVLYKTAEDCAKKINCHEEVHIQDKAKCNSERKNEVQMLEKNDAYRDQMLKMMTEFESMWDQHLGRIKAVKHHIQLTSTDENPIQSAP